MLLNSPQTIPKFVDDFNCMSSPIIGKSFISTSLQIIDVRDGLRNYMLLISRISSYTPRTKRFNSLWDILIKNNNRMKQHGISIEFTYTTKGFDMNKDYGFKFINRTLTDNEIDDFEAWAIKHQPDAILTELLAQGYKISFNFNLEQGSYSVTAIGNAEHKKNSNLALSAFSDDAFEALLLLGYKVIVLFDSGKWVEQQKRIRG